MASEVKIRPNIRVEIQNNLAEPMETEEIDKSDDGEEGEIIDNEMIEEENEPIPEQPSNFNKTNFLKNTFTTGINIFDKEEQEKLQERAKRFQLKPEEIHNFTDDNLQQLYLSLGLNSENENNIRYESLHLIGIENMSTEDLLDYFIKYAPMSIEYINDNCCNIVWFDRISTARAMFYKSKVIKGLPIRGEPLDDSNTFDNSLINDTEEETVGNSILLKNNEREIELQLDNDNCDDNNHLLNKTSNTKLNLDDAVDLNDINIAIPPGYWRLGSKHSKSKCLLLRFTFKTDEKPYKIEQFSKYYNKRQAKNSDRVGIFERNKDLNNEKNPWGSLAKNWDEDSNYREKERVINQIQPKQLLTIKNRNILQRLGNKMKNNPDDNNSENNKKSDDLQQQQEDDEEKEEGDDNIKRIKIPRMRMYADDEEEKIKRKKILNKIKQFDKITDTKTNKTTNNKLTDLRSILGITNRNRNKKNNEEEDHDLGKRLKNRNKRMIFSITNDSNEHLITGRDRSPIHHRNRSPPEYSTKHHSRQRRRTSHRSRSRSIDNNYDNNKTTRSKVAVVIKTHKRPLVASTVASTGWSRVNRFDDDSDSSTSSTSSSSSDDDSDSNTSSTAIQDNSNVVESLSDLIPVERPGFRSSKIVNDRLTLRGSDERSPLKIEINNDHFKNNK